MSFIKIYRPNALPLHFLEKLLIVNCHTNNPSATSASKSVANPIPKKQKGVQQHALPGYIRNPQKDQETRFFEKTGFLRYLS